MLSADAAEAALGRSVASQQLSGSICWLAYFGVLHSRGFLIVHFSSIRKQTPVQHTFIQYGIVTLVKKKRSTRGPAKRPRQEVERVNLIKRCRDLSPVHKQISDRTFHKETTFIERDSTKTPMCSM